jgi:D-3-phosphoglycerate dehydrogenase
MSEHKKVVVREALADEALAYLEEAGFEVVDGLAWAEGELARGVADCHGLIIGAADTVSAGVLCAAPNLEVVGRVGVRVDNVDVVEATRRGVIVVTTPQSNVISAAERATAMVLACAGNLAQTDHDLRAGRWAGDAWARGGVEVRGRTLGILGLGRLGLALAQNASVLGMNVMAYDPHAAARYEELPLVRVDDPARVWAEADFVVVHLAHSAETVGFVGAAELAKMKDGVRIINLSRAGVIDQAAWLAALEDGKVAAAATIVFEGDEVATGPLARFPAVLFAAHLDASTVDAQLRAGMMLAEQVTAVLRGQYASNAVNVPLTLGDDAAELMPYLGLCVQLGRLLVRLANGPVTTIEISYGGSFAYYDTRILALGVLEGVLADAVAGRVNYVNAQLTADARGVTARETRQSDIPDFPWMITVSSPDPGGSVSVSGTALGPDHKPRLVRVFGEDIDIEPAAHMLFLRYADRPGVGGAVGTMLGEWGVNIGHMSVGRGRVEHEAVMALTLDEPLTPHQLADLVTRCGLKNGKGVEL